MFMGQFKHNIDAKGRLIIPSKLREQCGDSVVVTRGLDGCLALYTIDGWNEYYEKLHKLPTTKRQARDYVRIVTSMADELVFDKLGRVNISSFLRKEANLENKEDGLHLSYEYYPIPEFDLPDLASISVEKNKYSVDDSVVEEAYKLSLQRFSHFDESESKSEIGDRVQVKIEFDDENNKKYNKELTVVASDDEDDSIFAKNAVGVKKDDKKLLTTYVDGVEATLIMNILKVEKPDMKDDSKEEDRQKVKESLKDHLVKRAEDKANSELINDTLFNKLIELVNITLPKGYYEEQLQISLDEFERSMSSRGMSKTDFLISVAKTDADIKKEYEESVRKQITFDMIMAKLAETYKDSITVNEEKAKEYANRMYQYQSYMGLSKRPKEEQQNIINYIMRDAQNRATSEAILDYVKEHVNVTEKDAGKFKPEENDVWGGY